jgi:hypothetical protein
MWPGAEPAVAQMLNLDRKSVWRILTEEFNMKKVCKMVPNMLLAEQKEFQKDISSDLLQHGENESDLLKSVTTCDETQIFTYDPEKNDSPCTGSHQTLQEKRRLHESF